jgi:hypothetical protein
MHVPTDAFGGMSPEYKAASALKSLFTMVAVRIVMAQEGAFYLTLIPIRARRRGERRSLRTLPGDSLLPPLAFDHRPRRPSLPPLTDAARPPAPQRARAPRSNVPASYAGEFRIQLYKQKESVMGGKAVVANAGIFVKNIVAHVVNNGAIDKTFKLFSKDGSASGGSVRLLIDFERFRDAIVVPPGEKFDIDAHKVKEDVAATKLQSAWRGKKARDELRRVGSGGALRALLAVAAAAVVGGLAFVVAKGAEGGGSAVGSKSGKGKKK